MKTERQETGKRGEDEACRYLESHGHSVIARNFRRSHTELDIVSIDRNGLHFVEVKTRTAPSAADPEDNVNEAKKRHLVQAAQDFLHSDSSPKGDFEIFFDVISVLIFQDSCEIEYYPQAFIPMYV